MRGIGVVRPSPAMVVAVAALGIGLAGGALAAGNSSPVIRACVHKPGGALYIARRCHKHDGKLSWNNIDPSLFYTKTQSDARYVTAGAQLGMFAYGQIRGTSTPLPLIRSASPNVTSVDHPGT